MTTEITRKLQQRLPVASSAFYRFTIYNMKNIKPTDTNRLALDTTRNNAGMLCIALLDFGLQVRTLRSITLLELGEHGYKHHPLVFDVAKVGFE